MHGVSCTKVAVLSCRAPLLLQPYEASTRLCAARLSGAWAGNVSGWPVLAVVALVTVAFLAAAFVSTLLLLRPLLRVSLQTVRDAEQLPASLAFQA